MQGYNYLNPNSINMNSNLYGQTQMVGGKQVKDILISHGLIQDEASPQKADSTHVKSSTNFNFKSKYSKNGFDNIVKMKNTNTKQGCGLKDSLSKIAKYEPLISKA